MDGMFMYIRSFKSRDASDGLSTTMFSGEVQGADNRTPNYPPTNMWSFADRYTNSLRVTENPLNTPPTLGTYVWRQANGAFGSMHAGGAHFVFGDGHVAFLSENISMTTYSALSTRADGDLPGAF